MGGSLSASGSTSVALIYFLSSLSLLENMEPIVVAFDPSSLLLDEKVLF